MQAQQLNIDVIANNLANVNTAGFKKSRADFQDVMYQNIKTTGVAFHEFHPDGGHPDRSRRNTGIGNQDIHRGQHNPERQ
jgi:flagellar basal body rod protein FlgG